MGDPRSSRLGEFVIALGLIAFFLAYGLHVAGVNFTLRNLILIAPVTVLGAALAASTIVRLGIDWWRARTDSSGSRRATSTSDPAATHDDQMPQSDVAEEDVRMIGWFFLALLIYVVLIPHLGVDVGTMLFLGFSLFIQGIRRIISLVLFPTIAAMILTLGLQKILSAPVPTLILLLGM